MMELLLLSVLSLLGDDEATLDDQNQSGILQTILLHDPVSKYNFYEKKEKVRGTVSLISKIAMTDLQRYP